MVSMKRMQAKIKMPLMSHAPKFLKEFGGTSTENVTMSFGSNTPKVKQLF